METSRSKMAELLCSWMSIDLRMLPSKVSYLLYGGILGSHIPFLTVFFVSVGLTTGQAGFINGMRFAPSSVAGPLWGMFADYTGRRKLIVILMCLGSAVTFFSMPWVSHSLQTTTTIPHNKSACVNITMATADCLQSKMATNDNSTLFYVLLAIVMVGSVFVGPLPGYVDSIVMNVVKTGATESSYGAQRIFGSLGFSLASFIAGVAADHFSVVGMSRYTAVFFLYLPCALLLIPFGVFIVGQTRWDDDDQPSTENEEETPLKEADPQSEETSKGWQIVWMLLRFDTMFFMLTALISGLACNLYVNFTILLVSDVIKTASKTELSLTIVIGTAAEVLLFPFTTKVIKILGGTSVAMTVGIFSYFVRFLVMSYTTQLWIMVAMQLLHALGFALTWAAMMDYLYLVTPSNVVLTMFLIFQSVHFGVAALGANVAGGYLYEAVGGRWLFRGFGVVCGIWTVLMVVYYGVKGVLRRGYVKLVDTGPVVEPTSYGSNA